MGLPVRAERGQGRPGKVVYFPDSPKHRLNRVAILAGLTNWSIDKAEDAPHTPYLAVEWGTGATATVTPMGVRYGLLIITADAQMIEMHDLTEDALVARLLLRHA